jgi:hypothetical protein
MYTHTRQAGLQRLDGILCCLAAGLVGLLVCYKWLSAFQPAGNELVHRVQQSWQATVRACLDDHWHIERGCSLGDEGCLQLLQLSWRRKTLLARDRQTETRLIFGHTNSWRKTASVCCLVFTELSLSDVWPPPRACQRLF